MTYRLALIVVLFAVSPASAQNREIEARGARSPLTLHAQPVTFTPSVYTLAPPAVALQQVDPPAEADPPMPKTRRMLIGAMIGAGVGCAFLAALNSSYGDSGENPAFCLVGAGIGTVPGALVAAAIHEAEP